MGEKTHLKIGKTPFRRVLMDHILSFDADPIFGCVVLFLASHAAGFTADASFLVDDQAESFFQSSTSLVLRFA